MLHRALLHRRLARSAAAALGSLLLARSAAAALGALLLASCATTPSGAAFEDADPFANLSPDGQLYFSLHVPSCMPILSALESAKNAKNNAGMDMVKRTRTAAGMIYLEPGSRKFLLDARGSYPLWQANISFTLNPDWRKTKSDRGFPYWRSDREKLSVLLTGKNALVSDGNPYAEKKGVAVPDYASRLMAGSALTAWIDDPAPLLSGGLGPAGALLRLPVSLAYLRVESPDEAGLYRLGLHLESKSSSEARATLALVSLLRRMASIGKDSIGALAADMFLSQVPQIDDRWVSFSSVPQTADRIALLLSSLIVYFDH